ncbi:MAG: XrtA/PEP-CTERM system-associated ATPase [Acetobacteraceae bacterium]
MYEKFYGLDGSPFLLTPDPRFFFSSSNHRRAITHLVYGLDQREGFIVITGEVGAGKTMLVEQLWHQLSRNSYAVSKVVTTQVSGDDLLRLVMDGFGLSILPGTEKSVLLRRFENMVREQRNVGRRCVLVVDEVQNLSFAALEELRMLSNITVDGKASVQTILLGQPQFRPTLASRDAEQLRQRVLASFHLGPLSEVETRLYIEHRLKTVGWSGNPHWDEDAFAAVHHHTDGIPRRINTLCSRVLQFAALEERTEITRAMVDEVANEMAEGMNGFDVPGQELIGAQQANPLRPGEIAANDTADLHPAYRAPSSGELGDLLHRIEALEEVTARQDRVFQRIIKMLALAVEKEP